jgi:hypothetical protein
MHQLAARILQRTAEHIATGWTQQADARTAEGEPTEPWAPDAASWSLLGALVAALEEDPNDESAKLPALARALDELAGLVDDDSLQAWNDRPDQTRENILAMLDIAQAGMSAVS